ncbi:MAG: fibronectin type III domain-containing protein, partial [Gammaproteobacteria bacterium]
MTGLTGGRWLLLAVWTIVLVAGCSSGGGDDGIDGTGLEGTAAVGAALSGAEVTIKDKDGATRTTTTNADGFYKFSDVSDLQAPFIIRVKTNNGKSYFSIRPSVEARKPNTANVHPFTDVAARNWFKHHASRDLDQAFDEAGVIENPPTQTEFDALKNTLKALLRFAYQDFDIDDTFDFIRTDFSANGEGFDGLLDNATVVIKENKVTIKIKDPVTGFEGKIVIKFDMNLDLGQEDSQAPSEPEGLLVVPASSSEMVVVWDASTDNVGVAGYNVYWGSDESVSEGSVTVPYPVFRHQGLTAGQPYCYQVQAIDGSGNTSTKTNVNPVIHCKQTRPDDGSPPDAPTNLQVSDSGLGTTLLTWDEPATNTDIIGYRIYRTVADASEQLHAATLLTQFEDIDVDENVEHCYAIAAVDAAFQESSKTIPSADSCVTPTKPTMDITPPTTSTNPAEGVYPSGGTTVELLCNDTGGSGCQSTYYATNVSVPVENFTLYGQSIDITSTTTLRYYSIDNAGNQEPVVTGVYTIAAASDTSPPVNETGADFVNSGALSTTNAVDVMLDIAATDDTAVTHYCVMDNSTGVTPTPIPSCWVPVATSSSYSDTMSYGLSGSYQYNDYIHVFVWFKDAADNYNVNDVAHDQIFYADPTSSTPTNTTSANFINWGAAWTSTPLVTLSITATDQDGDLVGYFVQNSTSGTAAAPAANDPGWVEFTPVTDFSDNVQYMFPGVLSNGQTIYAHVWFKDAAGNVSATSAIDDITISRNIYFSDNFEGGLSQWSVSGADWGVINSDSVSADHSVTDSPSGDYITDANAAITLAGTLDLSASVSPVLSFWMKLYNPDCTNGYDYGYVEVSDNGGVNWAQLASYNCINVSSWSQYVYDLSAYQGAQIKIRFRMWADGDTIVGDGFYVDDVIVSERGAAPASFPFSDDFESGLASWLYVKADWNIINSDSVSGSQSVTDSPGGEYIADANPAIVMADSVDLSGSVAPVLSFWMKLYNPDCTTGYDYGFVEASNDGGVTWNQLANYTCINVASWTQYVYDLSAYQGGQLKIRFRFRADGDGRVGDGFYVDDVEIRERDTGLLAFPFTDDFESDLGNWLVSGSDWAIINSDSVSGTQSVTDSPGGDYIPDANSAMTLADSVDLSASAAPVLSFWMKLYNPDCTTGYDYGLVEASSDGGITWAQLASFTCVNVASWTQYVYDLSAYQGTQVKVRFRLRADGDGRVGDGYYLDDVEIRERDTGLLAFPFIDDFESGLGNWLVSGSDWAIINTDSVSPTNSVTDSPGGNFVPDANAAITLA